MSRLRSSRAASSPEARVTEMVKGLLVSKPVEKEPVVIDLQEYARSGKSAASVHFVQENKLKVIQDFIHSNGRI